MTTPSLTNLVNEYERSLAYTASLVDDLSQDQIHWRSGEDASAIGWHLGHQAAVAHFMVRNLTAAEALIDPELDALMDSATAERDRGELPDLERLNDYRSTVADRVRFRIGNIDDGNVGAPAQLRVIAHGLLVAVINHEYQHSKWIGEVRSDVHGQDMPPEPVSPFLTMLDGYQVVGV
ncbi:DinB family protein [Acidimicrobiales bacterium]|nr:DinB family protein [Acidimicrobiaceae bacterium]MDB4102900.1 DinB family protein [Acidimicrobiales bacterium]HAY68032.1 hypothetical protein [Acidimicrobiaceae bacterium]